MLLQQTHGLFPRIIGKGDNAKRLVDLLIRMRTEASVESSSSSTFPFSPKPSTTVEDVIIIDRSTDPATPLLTQLTYEGLIDEFFTINNNHIEAPTSVVGSAAPANPPAPTTPSSTPSPQPPQPRPSSAPLKRKIPVDSTDALFASLRDTNFALVGSLLNQVARRLQAEYEQQRTGGTRQTTAQLRGFVARLPGYQAEQASLKTHTALAEEMMRQTREEVWGAVLEVQQGIVAAGPESAGQRVERVEELMARGTRLETVLRLLCLESVVGGGLRQRDYESVKRAVCHAYGHQHLLTFAALERMGLLVQRAGTQLSMSGLGGGANAEGKGMGAKTSDYAGLRRLMRLIVDDVDEHAPQDIAYAYSGYAPLSIRIVQAVLLKRYLATLTRASAGVVQQAKVAEEGVGASLGVKSGFKPFEEILRNAKGPTIELEQGNEGKEGSDRERARTILKGSGASAEKDKEKDKVTLIVFVGGVCYAEVAACRFVAGQLEKEGRGRRIVVLTTGMISGERMVGTAVQRQDFGNESANGHS